MGLHTINRLQILIDCSAMRSAWLLSAPIYWGFFVSNAYFVYIVAATAQ